MLAALRNEVAVPIHSRTGVRRALAPLALLLVCGLASLSPRAASAATPAAHPRATPDSLARTLDHWAAAHHVSLAFIRPGHPVEHCFIEHFNGKLRDECLNAHHFTSLGDAQRIIAQWRDEYHTTRPHRGLGRLTPVEMAAMLLERNVESPTTLRLRLE